MTDERREMNSEIAQEHLKAEYEALASRSERILEQAENELGKHRSNISSVVRNLLQPIRGNFEIWERHGAAAADLDMMRSNMEALDSYLDMLENDPKFFSGELNENGIFPDLTQEADSRVTESEKTGAKFHRHIFYVQEARKRIGK